ncbi:hypothetical protein D3C87_1379480 [compost metagenome]
MNLKLWALIKRNTRFLKITNRFLSLKWVTIRNLRLSLQGLVLKLRLEIKKPLTIHIKVWMQRVSGLLFFPIYQTTQNQHVANI